MKNNTLRFAIATGLLSLGLMASPITQAQMAHYEISVTNLTANQPLSPLAVVMHGHGYHTMEIGQPASMGLEKLAEGGDAGAFLDEAKGDMIYKTMMGDAPIPPGGTVTMMLEMDMDAMHMGDDMHGDMDMMNDDMGDDMNMMNDGMGDDMNMMNDDMGDDMNMMNDDMHSNMDMMHDGMHHPYLSFATMLVNTNDAFTSLNAKSLAGLKVGETMMIHTVAYDAGTELNTEMQGTIPGPADGGEGYNAERNDMQDMVTMHPGVVSKDDGLAGSVLNESHRFLNPVTMVKITRLEGDDMPEHMGTQVKFTDLQMRYKAGDRFLVEVEEAGTMMREQTTDLWAVLRRPDGVLLFATTDGNLSTTQQPFKVGVTPEQRKHTVFDAILPEGLDGDYMLLTFYGMYMNDIWTLHSNIMQHPFMVGE